MRTDARITADELALTVRGLLGEHADAITGISALSTVPAVLRELRVMLARYYPKLPKIVVEPGVRTGVPLLVDNPKEVGADRLANTLAAHHLHSTACVVVDFGTSTNVDAISAKGEFLGGAFAPGIEISVGARALVTGRATHESVVTGGGLGRRRPPAGTRTRRPPSPGWPPGTPAWHSAWRPIRPGPPRLCASASQSFAPSFPRSAVAYGETFRFRSPRTPDAGRSPLPELPRRG